MRERVGERRRSIEKTIGRATTLQERYTDGRGTVSDEKYDEKYDEKCDENCDEKHDEKCDNICCRDIGENSEGRGKAVREFWFQRSYHIS